MEFEEIFEEVYSHFKQEELLKKYMANKIFNYVMQNSKNHSDNFYLMRLKKEVLVINQFMEEDSFLDEIYMVSIEEAEDSDEMELHFVSDPMGSTYYLVKDLSLKQLIEVAENL